MLEALRDWAADNADAIKAAAAGVVVVALLTWWLSDPPVEVGARATAASRALILLHGHGASKNDLRPLAKQLSRAAPGVTFLLPNAPHRAMFGRTWYPSFTADSQEAVQVRLQELRAEAREVVLELVEDLEDDGVPTSEIYIGGFSQGATVALDVILEESGDRRFGGLVSLSGGALGLNLAPLSRIDKVRAFVSHGNSDSVLNGGGSHNLVQALKAHDHDVQFVEFPGGHTIPDQVVEDLEQFLAEPTE